jgi:SAM-dependent methyltransferase
MTRRVLNVGGGKDMSIHPRYDGWQQLMLDIDPKTNPDICADARELGSLEPGQFDAVYCAHNLEHYYSHDVPKVLAGFLSVLKADGYAEIIVPDLGQVMRRVVNQGVDITEPLYESPSGPIAALDILFGHRIAIAKSGEHYYAHKTGFTRKSLVNALLQTDFAGAACWQEPQLWQLRAFGFKSPPTDEQKAALIPHHGTP